MLLSRDSIRRSSGANPDLAAAQERIAALLTDQRAKSDSCQIWKRLPDPARAGGGNDGTTEKLDPSKMNRFSRC